MKKKIALTLLGLVCVFSCMFGLVACGDKPTPRAYELYITDGVNNDYLGGVSNYPIDIEYGENFDLSKYKLFLHYTDGSDQEIARTDEKLAVKYYYYDSTIQKDQEITALPDEKVKGTYTIEYIYDGNTDLKACVYLNVAQAKSGAFTLQLIGGDTWQSFGEIHDVILKNPKGVQVEKEYIPSDDHGGATLKPIANQDDTDGHYELYLFEKNVYDGFTAEQQKDYDFLYNYCCANYNAAEPTVYNYDPKFNNVVGVPEGVYMLVALINETYNYRELATPAVQITVTAAAAE